MCAVDDADPCDVQREEQPRARKPRSCLECGRTIVVGERYHLIVGLYDGRWLRHWHCRHCESASVWLVAVCGGWILGGLAEELVEHWDEGYRSVGMARLIAGMRTRWHDGRAEVPTGVRDLAEQMMRAAVAA